MIENSISRDDFIEQFYEKKFLFLKNSIKRNLVSWEDINRALFSWDPRDGNLRLFNHGPVPLERYTESYIEAGAQRARVLKDVFYNLMREGATLVLNRVDTKIDIVHEITTQFAQYLGERAVANGYVAFGGEGTFGQHWDTHDVFAIQLIGKKRWRLYEPTFELPLPHQTSKERKQECPSSPVFDEVLDEGDVLYFPRGWWHEALPIEGEETFHIAVGVRVTNVSDYIIWSCINAAMNNVGLRKSIKFESDCVNGIEAAVDLLKSILSSKKNLEGYKNSIAAVERFSSPFSLESLLKNKSPGKDIRNFRVNSAYIREQSDTNIINGIMVCSEKMSQRARDVIFGRAATLSVANQSTEEDERLMNLIVGLLERDILSERKIHDHRSHINEHDNC
jgi:ribosomal protein L16 Arg81 hydroxylase